MSDYPTKPTQEASVWLRCLLDLEQQKKSTVVTQLKRVLGESRTKSKINDDSERAINMVLNDFQTSLGYIREISRFMAESLSAKEEA